MTETLPYLYARLCQMFNTFIMEDNIVLIFNRYKNKIWNLNILFRKKFLSVEHGIKCISFQSCVSHFYEQKIFFQNIVKLHTKTHICSSRLSILCRNIFFRSYEENKMFRNTANTDWCKFWNKKIVIATLVMKSF